MLGVADHEQGLEPAQRAVLAPILGQLDGGAHDVFILGQFCLELLEQRDAVRRAAREPRQRFAAGKPPHLMRAVFDDRLVERHLTVAGDGQLAVAPHRENSRRANLHAEAPAAERAASPRASSATPSRASGLGPSSAA